MLKVIYSAVILHLLWSSPLSAQAQEYQPFPEYTEFAQANPSTMALFEACKSTEPSLQTVNELIEQGADVNAQLPAPFAGMTPLAYAVQTDQDGAIITALLEAGADPDWHWHLDNTDGSILVYAAVGNSNPKVIRQLIENGARVNPKPYKCPSTGGMRNPFTPLMASMSNRNPEIAATLLESGANIDTTDESLLFSSTFGGFGGPKYEGPTALAYACGYNAHEVHPEVIPVLLEHGASLKPTVCDGQGNKRTQIPHPSDTHQEWSTFLELEATPSRFVLQGVVAPDTILPQPRDKHAESSRNSCDPHTALLEFTLERAGPAVSNPQELTRG